MQGFTPEFFLQLLLAIGTAGAVYGAIKADLKNMHFRLSEQQRLREEHEKSDDKNFTELRDHLADHHGRLSRMEGQNDLAERIAEAIQRR